MSRILIADDHQIVKDGIRMILESVEFIQEIEEANDGDEMLRKALEFQPDLILSDLKMPGMSVLESTTVIKEKYPQTKIVVLTAYDDHGDIYRAMQNEVDGYLMKDTPPAQIIETIQEVLSGATHFQPNVSNLKENPQTLIKLTPREKEVYRHLAENLSNQEIADKLLVSETTVKSHVSQILRKTGQPNRSQAVQFGMKHNLLDSNYPDASK
jgi:DNA-binding NarL/FixJ family response regulator